MDLAAIPPYRPRPVRLLGIERAGGWRIKVYGIAAAAERPRPPLVDAARKIAVATLPAPNAGGTRSPLDRPEQLQALRAPAAGCVWELAVTGHERDAWVRHVLTRPADADIEAYLCPCRKPHPPC